MKMPKILKSYILVICFASIMFGFVFFYRSKNDTILKDLMVSYQTCDSNIESQSSVEIIQKSLKIFCFILTHPGNHNTSAVAVNNTWGKHCDYLYFITTESNTSDLNTIIYPAPTDDRNILWGKTKLGFRYIHDNYLEKADWFVKADDDTFLIVENLRVLLNDYNTSDPIWFGCKYWTIVKQGYMSGGGGYVLSRKAVKNLIEILDSKDEKKNCRFIDDNGAEDAEMGKCLEAANVTAGDSRDAIGEHRFFGLNLHDLVPPGPRDETFWYFTNQFYPLGDGSDCCSNMTIALHYVNPAEMYILYFYIYKFKVSKLKFENSKIVKR